MSSTGKADYLYLGKGGDYEFDINFAIRIYDDQGERIPECGERSATLKGGQRTNYHGIVPILNGTKMIVGKANLELIVDGRPEFMKLEDIQACGFKTIEDAVKYVKTIHPEEFKRDGVLTVFYYSVIERHAPVPMPEPPVK